MASEQERQERLHHEEYDDEKHRRVAHERLSLVASHLKPSAPPVRRWYLF